MINNCYQKTKKGFEKKRMKDSKIFLKKKQTKRANMLISNIEIFCEEKEKKRQYGCKRYKNLLEDKYKKFSLKCKK